MWWLRRRICSGFAPDSGRFGLDLAQCEQGLQGLRAFVQGPVRPDQCQKPGQHQFQEVLGLTLAMEKRSRAWVAAWRRPRANAKSPWAGESGQCRALFPDRQVGCRPWILASALL